MWDGVCMVLSLYEDDLNDDGTNFQVGGASKSTPVILPFPIHRHKNLEVKDKFGGQELT